MKRTACLIFSLAVVLLAAQAQSAAYDLIVRHGRLVDGTGNPAFFADIGVTKGRIAAIGRISGKAKREVDATGMIVTPGFIDVHTHADDIAEMPQAENFARMGVTTIVVGNCGTSAADIGKLFRDIEARKVSVNVASLIGHGEVRAKAMGGSFDRAPTPEELATMKSLVAQAMQDGAVGMSTGLIYLPGTFAKTDEIVELAKVVSDYDGIYTTHMRDEGRNIFASLDEVFRIAREANIRAEISHIKLSGNASWGQAGKVLAAIEQARAEGLDITQDEYVYTASSTGISQLVPDSAREGGKFQERIADPHQKSAIVAQMKSNLAANGRTNYEYAVIADYQTDPGLNGLTIPEASKAKRGSDSLDDQIELILEIVAHHGAQGVFHGISEDDLQQFLRDPNTMIGSDSGVREFGKGVPHPRGYGNSARVLARYVRELKVLRLEDAIRRMTTLPAETFRLRDRGELCPGNWADLVIFDPAKIQDNATYQAPHHYATGIQFVFVNGVEVVKDGEYTGARPGMALRHLTPKK